MKATFGQAVELREWLIDCAATAPGFQPGSAPISRCTTSG